MRYKDQGFTAVELLVALIVGALLLASAYQLHVNVLHEASDAQRRSQASNAAYDLLRQYQGNSSMVTNPCTTHTAAPTVPSYANLPGATATVAITCPYSGSTDLSLVTVTIKYNATGSTQQVYRAITTRPS